MDVMTIGSSSKPGSNHMVTRRGDGSCYCTCPGYSYRRHCSHIPQAVAAWAAIDRNRTAALTLRTIAQRVDRLADKVATSKDADAWPTIQSMHELLNKVEATV